LSVTYDRSVVFSEYSGFLHQQNWPPRYNWNCVESGVIYNIPALYLKLFIQCEEIICKLYEKITLKHLLWNHRIIYKEFWLESFSGGPLFFVDVKSKMVAIVVNKHLIEPKLCTWMIIVCISPYKVYVLMWFDNPRWSPTKDKL